MMGLIHDSSLIQMTASPVCAGDFLCSRVSLTNEKKAEISNPRLSGK